MDSVHLLVLVHGMWGNPNHLASLEKAIKRQETKEGEIPFHVIVAKTNSEDCTYDGIDWGGERVAKEIVQEVEVLESEQKKVVKFSITGYSLGGLVSRYVVGILSQRGFFENVEPINFNTVATPHLGLPRYPTFLSALTSTLGPKLLSRTGEQFYCVDKWNNTGKPLIEIMADPELVFHQALAKFKHIRIYANAIHDLTVPYLSAAIEEEDAFAERAANGLEINFDDDYKHLITSFSLPPQPPVPSPKATLLTPQWFRQRKDQKNEKKKKRAMVPPFLQFRFPLNIVFYATLPILIPVFMSIAIVRLSRESRGSKARIRLLEKDTTRGETLAQMLSHLENEVEQAMVELIDVGGAAGAGGSTQTLQGSEIDPESGKKVEKKEKRSILSPVQTKIARQLNTLPIKKELAFFEEVYNAHGMIIMRDVKRFPFQEEAEGIVRHWVDHLIR